jgi:uncharacterized protein YjbJ (UPF0337 family)
LREVVRQFVSVTCSSANSTFRGRKQLAARSPIGPEIAFLHASSELALRRDGLDAATFYKEPEMNWDQIEGNWKKFKGKVKQQWGKLTDDDLDQVSGKKDELVGRIQERYGYERDQAEKEVDRFCQSC